jgi:hypothetical protein
MHALVALAFSFVTVTTQNDACHTSRGNDTHPPAAVLARAGIPGSGLHGNGTIWTVAWPDDTVTFRKDGPGTIEPDGSLKMKFFWVLATDGPLTVAGRRLDGSAAPLRAEIPAGFVGQGFQPSGLIFSTPGCWEVTARANGSEFTFVTKVAKAY